jgi:hypothetical protein
MRQDNPVRGRFRSAAQTTRVQPISHAAKTKRHAEACPSEYVALIERQRLENWKLRRALALPYFLRSTTRLSRVRKPPRLSTPRKSGSK